LSDIELAVAKVFKLRGKSRLNRTEFTFALSYELKWFTPEESKEVLEAALSQGLLKEEGGKLTPTFNIKALEIPADFKPGKEILAVKSLFDSILGLLATGGVDRETAMRLIEEKQKSYGDLVTPETAGLVLAREKGLDIGPYVDEAYLGLTKK
jgi:hypothetical protein